MPAEQQESATKRVAPFDKVEDRMQAMQAGLYCGWAASGSRPEIGLGKVAGAGCPADARGSRLLRVGAAETVSAADSSNLPPKQSVRIDYTVR